MVGFFYSVTPISVSVFLIYDKYVMKVILGPSYIVRDQYYLYEAALMRNVRYELPDSTFRFESV